jgi:hypothetical protein
VALASAAASFGAAPPSGRGVLHWPDICEAAVSATGRGLLGSSPRRARVPIASLTTMMKALIVLRDHPLRPGEPGPSVAFHSSNSKQKISQRRPPRLEHGDAPNPV